MTYYLYKIAHCNVLMVEYRGYGKSSGKPSESGTDNFWIFIFFGTSQSIIHSCLFAFSFIYLFILDLLCILFGTVYYNLKVSILKTLTNKPHKHSYYLLHTFQLHAFISAKHNKIYIKHDELFLNIYKSIKFN
jgi:hypothetical protein